MNTEEVKKLPLNELKALFLFLGKAIVDRTDNKLDDTFYNIIAKMIESEKSVVDLIFDIF